MSLQNFIILNDLNMEDAFGELFVLIMGGLLLIYFFILLYFIRKARKWPTTIGQILFSEVATSGSIDELHRVVIKYEYQVQRKLYVSNRLNYGHRMSTSSLSYARKKVKQYFPGRKCTVHYNPQKPQSAVLETSLSSPLYLLLFSGILCIFLGLVSLFR